MTTRDPKKVLIGMAIGNGTTRWETSYALLSMLFAGVPGYEFEIIPGGGCDVAHARNLMFHHWRTKSEAGKMIFIDSDVKFTFGHIGRLLLWMEKYPVIEYLAGLYPLKGLDPRWSYGGWSRESVLDPLLWEVFEVCTGFTMFTWSLHEKMLAAYGEETSYTIEDQAYRGETGYELFAMGPVTREWVEGGRYTRRVPEDFYFSMRARDLGVPIYVDPKIQLGHVGTVDFLDLQKKGEKQPAMGHA